MSGDPPAAEGAWQTRSNHRPQRTRTEQNVRHVLVIEAAEPVGMLSMRDVVRVIGKAADPA